MNSIADIEHGFYINLASRTDRKQQVEAELRKVSLTCVHRFNAIKLDDGRIGCSMSHLKCLNLAKENNWSHVLICEVESSIFFMENRKKCFFKFLNYLTI
jgi:hypothetical protein